jgi:hypothetical protein
MTMENMTFDGLIEITRNQAPRLFFEVGAETLAEIRKFRDYAGSYAWNPESRSDQPDTLLGYPIKIVPGNGARLITVVTEDVNIVRLQDL